MSSASLGKASRKGRGNILVLTLTLVAVTSALSLAGLERTTHQSQLAAALVRQSVLRTEAANALTAAARTVSDERALPFTPECPPRCDWRDAQRVSAAPGVAAAYLVQRAAPGRFLIVARAAHAGGGEAVVHGLFDSRDGAFRLIR